MNWRPSTSGEAMRETKTWVRRWESHFIHVTQLFSRANWICGYFIQIQHFWVTYGEVLSVSLWTRSPMLNRSSLHRENSFCSPPPLGRSTSGLKSLEEKLQNSAFVQSKLIVMSQVTCMVLCDCATSDSSSALWRSRSVLWWWVALLHVHLYVGGSLMHVNYSLHVL